MLNNKKKSSPKERGITLIALIITIIVLLILAGVALSALTGDSGILNNTEGAKEKTSLANAKEQVALAAQGALTKGHAEGSGTITRDNLKNELDNIVGEINKDYTLSEGESPWTVKVGKYETLVYATGKIEQNDNPGGAGDGVGDRDITTLPSRAGTTPWLPAGFSQVVETTLNTGLTITNTNKGTPGTQNYVWIEVPTTIDAEINGKTVTLANASNDEEILEILEVYAGKGTITNYRNSDFKDEWYDSKTNTIKPDESNKDDIAGCGMTYSEYKTAYSDMLKSIKTYGGFWLAQYEAGIAPEKEGEQATYRSNHTSITITNANYAKDQYPYNYVYCREAQQIANADSTSSYTSSLPFGIQWDLVCKFLEVNTELEYEDIAEDSSWGNYYNVGWTSSDNSKYSESFNDTFKSGSKTKSSGNYLLTTGAIEKTIYDSTEYIANPMNIYDFAGNVNEWTLEYSAKSAQKYPCVSRGGSCNCDKRSYPAGCRVSNNTTLSDSYYIGFRSVLY